MSQLNLTIAFVKHETFPSNLQILIVMYHMCLKTVKKSSIYTAVCHQYDLISLISGLPREKVIMKLLLLFALVAIAIAQKWSPPPGWTPPAKWTKPPGWTPPVGWTPKGGKNGKDGKGNGGKGKGGWTPPPKDNGGKGGKSGWTPPPKDNGGKGGKGGWTPPAGWTPPSKGSSKGPKGTTPLPPTETPVNVSKLPDPYCHLSYLSLEEKDLFDVIYND